MKVVVTGGAGFIGSHVTDVLLGDGHEVLVVDDLSTGRLGNLDAAAGNGLTDVVEADAAGPEARRAMAAFKPEAVLLLAAQSSVKVSMRDPVRDARDNVLGLVTVLEAACDLGVGKVVFATSGGTIYGQVREEELPIVESDRGRPDSFYGLTKRAGVEYLRLYHEHRGLDNVALALGNVYGPRQDPDGEAGVVAIFLDRLARGLPCVVNGDGATTRDYVHVHDVARAFVAAMERGTGLVNIGTGRETSTNDVYGALSRHFPQAGPAEHGPALPGEIRRVSLDAGRAREVLGWRARVDFQDGVDVLVRTSLDAEGA
jgi:UDP-glucose 4-epimerase